MNNFKDIKYLDLCNWIDDSPNAKIILDYSEWQVWQDTSDNKYYYIERSENDASDFCEVKLIGRLSFDFKMDTDADALVQSHAIFPSCFVCGEKFLFSEDEMDNYTAEYLYFEKVSEFDWEGQ